MKRRKIAISIILHALLLVTVYVFQSTIFPYIRLYGYAPLLLPVVSTGVAVYEGRHTGGIVGIFAGMLCDVSFNEPVGVFTVLLTVTGLIVGTVADTVMTRNFVTFVICCACVLSLCAFVQIFPLLFFDRDQLLQPLITVGIRQTAYSILFAPLLWFFVRALGVRAQRVLPAGKQ